MRLDDLDLTDLDNFARGFPHHLFAIHRREAPVWWHPPTPHTPDGEGFWSVATYGEVVQVLKDPATYSSERGGDRPYGGTLLQDLPIAGVLLNMMDGTRHDRIRRLVSVGRAGGARRVDAQQPPHGHPSPAAPAVAPPRRIMRIGMIGTGTMGAAMAGRLLEAGHEVVVHDARPEAAATLLAAKATWAASPAEVGERCRIVLSSLPGPAEVEAVSAGKRGLWQVYFAANRLIRKSFGAAGYAVPEQHYVVGSTARAPA